jgi:hypothetical protein
MTHIHIADSAWQTTFPFLVAPLPSIRATTYQAELARLYGVADPQMALLSPTSFSFRLCPACVASARRLSRTLTLPYITACPHHRITLVTTCLCGTALRPFHRQASPFACPKCHLDWAKLPCQEADTEHIEREEKLVSYYKFFLTKGTPEILASALRLIYDSVVEKGEIRVPLPDDLSQASSSASGISYQRTSSLGYLVHALWQLDLSPRDILMYTGPLPWRSMKWLTFQCSEPRCPYVSMLRDRAHLLDAAGDSEEDKNG